METKIIAGLNVNLYKPSKKVKGVLIFTHGIAEYSKSYHEVACYFKSKDYFVITYDLRGHGKSLGKRGYLNSWQDLISDLGNLVQLARTKSEKVYLVGHSLGGVVSNLYALLKAGIEGVIITASPTTYLKELRILKYFPRFLINNFKIKTDFNDVNLVHDNVYRVDEHDLKYFYFRYINEVRFKGMKVLVNNYHNYQTPILMIYSEKDKLASLNYGKLFYQKIKSERKELFILKESYHNIFNDLEKEIVFKKILSWVEKR